MGEEHRPRFLHRAWGLDLETFFSQVNQVRLALPEEIKTANRVLEDRDRILASAAAERDRLLEAAREQAALLVAHDEVVRQARRQADEVMRQAGDEAAEVRRGSEEYAMRALANLEEYVLRVLAAVRAARERLSTPTDGTESQAGP